MSARSVGCEPDAWRWHGRPALGFAPAPSRYSRHSRKYSASCRCPRCDRRAGTSGSSSSAEPSEIFHESSRGREGRPWVPRSSRTKRPPGPGDCALPIEASTDSSPDSVAGSASKRLAGPARSAETPLRWPETWPDARASRASTARSRPRPASPPEKPHTFRERTSLRWPRQRLRRCQFRRDARSIESCARAARRSWSFDPRRRGPVPHRNRPCARRTNPGSSSPAQVTPPR